MKHPRYLLIQIRNPGDPMRENEIGCFARALECPRENIEPFDLIGSFPADKLIARMDAVLIGGSGDYSVVTGGPWLPAALDVFRRLHATAKPTFASCWGFQAFARALGGEVVTDPQRAELGTHPFQLTEAGISDPVFGPLGSPFFAQIGHQDIVDQLPGDAILLCSTAKVRNQAFTFAGMPIYATQFHPELEMSDLLARVCAYPEYVKSICGLTVEEFRNNCQPTPDTLQLLSRFARHVFGG